MDIAEMERRVVALIQQHGETMKPLIEKSMTLSTHIGAVMEFDGAIKAFRRMLPNLKPDIRRGMELAIELLEARIKQIVSEFDQDAKI